MPKGQTLTRDEQFEQDTQEAMQRSLDDQSDPLADPLANGVFQRGNIDAALGAIQALGLEVCDVPSDGSCGAAIIIRAIAPDRFSQKDTSGFRQHVLDHVHTEGQRLRALTTLNGEAQDQIQAILVAKVEAQVFTMFQQDLGQKAEWAQQLQKQIVEQNSQLLAKHSTTLEAICAEYQQEIHAHLLPFDTASAPAFAEQRADKRAQSDVCSCVISSIREGYRRYMTRHGSNIDEAFFLATSLRCNTSFTIFLPTLRTDEPLYAYYYDVYDACTQDFESMEPECSGKMGPWSKRAEFHVCLFNTVSHSALGGKGGSNEVTHFMYCSWEKDGARSWDGWTQEIQAKLEEPSLSAQVSPSSPAGTTRHCIIPLWRAAVKFSCAAWPDPLALTCTNAGAGLP